MRKTIEEIKSINTNNLLKFYRAERNRMFLRGYKYIVIDEDEKGNPITGWTNSSDNLDREAFNDDINYLYTIKKELNKRENIL